MEWIVNQNISHFMKLIESESDPAKLVALKGLLQEQTEKLAVIHAGKLSH